MAKWPADKLYYMVKLIKIDQNDRLFVQFEDGTQHWSNASDLHIQFNSDDYAHYQDDDSIVCCVCDDGTSEKPNEIVLCDVCQQGYHQKCHQPQLDSDQIDDDDEWCCATCQYILEPKQPTAMLESTPKRTTKSRKDRAAIRVSSVAKPKSKLQNRVKLPKVKANKNKENGQTEHKTNGHVDSSSSDEEDAVKELQNGTTIEKMNADVINYAIEYSKENNNVVTNDFVQVLAPNSELKKPHETQENQAETVTEAKPESENKPTQVKKPRNNKKAPRKATGNLPPPA